MLEKEQSVIYLMVIKYWKFPFSKVLCMERGAMGAFIS